MSLEEHRASAVPTLRFSTADSRLPLGLRRRLGGAVASGALPRDPAVRDPERRQDRAQHRRHHADRHRGHARARDRRADRVLRARRVAGDGDVPLAGARQLSAPDDPHSDGGAGGVVDPVRGAVVSRRRIPHRLRAGGGVRAGVPDRYARRHARRAARAAPHDAVVPADHAAVFPQADPAGDRADHLHQLEGQHQPGDPRRHHCRAGGRGHRHRPSAVGGAGIVLGLGRVRLDHRAGGAAVPARGHGRARRSAPVAVAA